jgi:hypothetical protein
MMSAGESLYLSAMLYSDAESKIIHVTDTEYNDIFSTFFGTGSRSASIIAHTLWSQAPGIVQAVRDFLSGEPQATDSDLMTLSLVRSPDPSQLAIINLLYPVVAERDTSVRVLS